MILHAIGQVLIYAVAVGFMITVTLCKMNERKQVRIYKEMKKKPQRRSTSFDEDVGSFADGMITAIALDELDEMFD